MVRVWVRFMERVSIRVRIKDKKSMSRVNFLLLNLVIFTSSRIFLPNSSLPLLNDDVPSPHCGRPLWMVPKEDNEDHPVRGSLTVVVVYFA